MGAWFQNLFEVLAFGGQLLGALSLVTVWVGGVAAVAFKLIGENWLQSYFSTKVEKFRAEQHQELEKLRAELRAKETQIAALRDGALSSMAALQTAIAQRRLKAADDLWAAVNEWNKLIGAVSQMSVFDFEECSKHIAKEPKMQALFKTFNVEISTLTGAGAMADSARPYLSDLAWALFSAYRTVFHVSTMQVHMLSNGIDGRKFFNVDGSNDLMIAALPDYKAYIEKFGHKCYSQLLDVLRNRILTELRSAIEGKLHDSENVERAAHILNIAEQIQRKADGSASKGVKD